MERKQYPHNADGSPWSALSTAQALIERCGNEAALRGKELHLGQVKLRVNEASPSFPRHTSTSASVLAAVVRKGSSSSVRLSRQWGRQVYLSTMTGRVMGCAVCIGPLQEHLEKLRLLYKRHGPAGASDSDFLRAVFCLIVRYKCEPLPSAIRAPHFIRHPAWLLSAGQRAAVYNNRERALLFFA